MRSRRISVGVLLIGALFLAPAAFAQEEDEEPWDPSKPLSNVEERRIDRSLKRDQCPRGGGQKPDFVARCEYRLEQQRANDALRRENRFRVRDRIGEEEEEEQELVRERPPFDEFGEGSTPLGSHLAERRVKRYVTGSGQCHRLPRDEERVRCEWLIAKLYHERELIQEEKGQRRARRNRPVSAQFVPRGSRMGVQQLTQEELREIEAIEAPVTDFDFSAPGSTPLSAAIESRLKRYVDSEKCPVTLHEDVQQRCDYLIALKRFRSRDTTQRALQRSELRRREYDISRRVRGDVIGTYTNVIRNVGTAYTNQRRLEGGLRARPRTRREAEEQFQAPVVIEGDEN